MGRKRNPRPRMDEGASLLSNDANDVEAIEKRNERATREGFAKNRVVWFGGPDDWVRDWVFYVENTHTLVSMWCVGSSVVPDATRSRGHSMHHFDRFDRIVHLCCVLCANLFISAWLERERDDANVVEYYWWVAVWSASLVVYDNALRVLATSPCCQIGGSLHDICCLCRDCFRDCGRQGLVVCLVASCCIGLVGLILAVHRRVDASRFFATFVAVRLFAYLYELAPLSCALTHLSTDSTCSNRDLLRASRGSAQVLDAARSHPSQQLARRRCISFRSPLADPRLPPRATLLSRAPCPESRRPPNQPNAAHRGTLSSSLQVSSDSRQALRRPAPAGCVPATHLAAPRNTGFPRSVAPGPLVAEPHRCLFLLLLLLLLLRSRLRTRLSLFRLDGRPSELCVALLCAFTESIPRRQDPALSATVSLACVRRSGTGVGNSPRSRSCCRGPVRS